MIPPPPDPDIPCGSTIVLPARPRQGKDVAVQILALRVRTPLGGQIVIAADGAGRFDGHGKRILSLAYEDPRRDSAMQRFAEILRESCCSARPLGCSYTTLGLSSNE
jgi:hypothetical protein